MKVKERCSPGARVRLSAAPALKKHGSASARSHPGPKLEQGRHNHPVEKLQGEQDDNRRKIEPPDENKGQPFAYPVIDRFGQGAQSPHYRVVRIGIHPGKEGRDNDDERIEINDDLQQTCHGHQQVAYNKHEASGVGLNLILILACLRPGIK